MAAACPMLAWGYWPGCYRPQVGLGVLAWLQQPTGGTGLAATALRIAWGNWSGCYRLQVGLRVLAWLLQASGWPEGYWPGCCRPQIGLGVLTCLLQPAGGSGLAATGPRLACGYWLGCYSQQGYWPGCYKPHVGLGVLAWLLKAPFGLRGTGLDASCPRVA